MKNLRSVWHTGLRCHRQRQHPTQVLIYILAFPFQSKSPFEINLFFNEEVGNVAERQLISLTSQKLSCSSVSEKAMGPATKFPKN